jgi:prepilin peptidase CpaA
MTSPRALQFLALVVMLAGAVVMDVRERRIPNVVTVPGLLAGVILAVFGEGGFPGEALGGVLVAFAVSVPFVLLGGLGGGDAKLLTAVGAFVGVGGLLSVLLYGALAGGILAVANAVRRGAILGVLMNTKSLIVYLVTLGRHGERIALDSEGAETVPYGLAIAAGTLVAWFFPLSLAGIQ